MKRPNKASRQGRVWKRLAALAAALVAAAVLLAISPLGQGLPGLGSSGPPAAPRAIIVDQTAVYDPNPDFISEVRGTLAAAGYTVEYIAGEDVTVDVYRSLPDRGYDLVLLRVHAGITTEVNVTTGERTGTEYVSLFTGEAYDEEKYSANLVLGLGSARYNQGSDPLFAIGPAFVENSMQGDFGGALVVMMGCDGLRSQRTGQAFLDKGAGAFVSWDDLISWDHSDAATERLLELVLVDGLDAAVAVEQTAAEFGPDPYFGAELRVLTPER